MLIYLNLLVLLFINKFIVSLSDWVRGLGIKGLHAGAILGYADV